LQGFSLRSVGAGIYLIICIGFSYTAWLHTFALQTGDLHMPITLHVPKKQYSTRSILVVQFEALEQTLRLRLVSGRIDKKCLFLS
jgi:hypothetical protein